MSTLDPQKPCPCTSQKNYSECCQPFHLKKKKPLTAEQLLRARYCAFAANDIDYVIDTHHSETQEEINRKEVEEWAKSSEWVELQVAQVEAGTEKDEEAKIIFCARYREKKDPSDSKPKEHWEQSFFKKEKGDWKFFDAKGVHIGTYRREEPKIGRNDPCPCGSKKKYKKCCG